MKALMYNDDTLGQTWEEVDIPESLVEKANEYRHKLLEAVSEVDDTLLDEIS